MNNINVFPYKRLKDNFASLPYENIIKKDGCLGSQILNHPVL
jgi:hypothetical protein